MATVSKVADPVSGSDVTPGETIPYTINVTNSGTVDLTNVVVTDTLDPNLDPATVVPLDGGSFMDPTVTWTIGTLAAGASISVSFEVDVKITTPVGTTIFNHDVLTANELPTTFETDVTEHFVISAPAIDVDMTPDNQLVDVSEGDPLIFTYVVTNTGNVTLTGVDLTDIEAGDIPLTSATLAPGASTTVTRTFTVTQADIDLGRIDESAVTTGDGGVPVQTVSDTDPGSYILAQNPAIQVVKLATPQTVATAGDLVTYDYTVTNTGNVTLTNVSLNDDVEGAITLGTTTLAPGQSTTGTTTHTMTQAEIDAGSLTNTATAAGTDPNNTTVQDQDDETVTATPAPSIDVVKSASPTSGLVVGDIITYTFDVTNAGDVTLVDDVLGTIILSDNAGDGVGALAPGDTESGSATHPVTQADVDGGTLTNVATATGQPPAGRPVDGDDQVDIPFVNLSLTKTSAVTLVTVDLTNIAMVFSTNGNSESDSATDLLVVSHGEITYTLTVTNSGDADATGVVLTDTLPAAASTVIANPDGGAVLGSTVTWNLGTVAASTSVTVSITVRA